MSRRYHFWPLLNHRSCKGELSKILYNFLESCSIIISNDVQLHAWFEGLQLFLYIYASVFIYFLFLFFAPANRRTNQSKSHFKPSIFGSSITLFWMHDHKIFGLQFLLPPYAYCHDDAETLGCNPFFIFYFSLFHC